MVEPVNVRDFPLRDRKVTFKVRRRKWVDKTTGKYITNRFNIVAEGTLHSKEFAAFFKVCLEKYPIKARSLEQFYHSNRQWS